MAAPAASLADDLAPPARRFSLLTAIRRNPTIALGGILLLALVVMAVFAPLIATHDPPRHSYVYFLRVCLQDQYAFRRRWRHP